MYSMPAASSRTVNRLKRSFTVEQERLSDRSVDAVVRPFGMLCPQRRSFEGACGPIQSKRGLELLPGRHVLERIGSGRMIQRHASLTRKTP